MWVNPFCSCVACVYQMDLVFPEHSLQRAKIWEPYWVKQTSTMQRAKKSKIKIAWYTLLKKNQVLNFHQHFFHWKIRLISWNLQDLGLIFSCEDSIFKFSVTKIYKTLSKYRTLFRYEISLTNTWRPTYIIISSWVRHVLLKQIPLTIL